MQDALADSYKQAGAAANFPGRGDDCVQPDCFTMTSFTGIDKIGLGSCFTVFSHRESPDSLAGSLSLGRAVPESYLGRGQKVPNFGKICPWVSKPRAALEVVPGCLNSP